MYCLSINKCDQSCSLRVGYCRPSSRSSTCSQATVARRTSRPRPRRHLWRLRQWRPPTPPNAAVAPINDRRTPVAGIGAEDAASRALAIHHRSRFCRRACSATRCATRRAASTRPSRSPIRTDTARPTIRCTCTRRSSCPSSASRAR